MPRRTDPVPTRAVDLARRQDGLLTRGQAVAAGMTVHQVEANLRTARWSRVLPGVYLTRAGEPTPYQFIHAVHLWAGPDSVIDGLAALITQRRSELALTQVGVVVPRHPRVPTGPWPISPRRNEIDPYWRLRCNNIWTVRTEFAIAQLLPAHGPGLLDDAVRRRWVTVDMVIAAHEFLSPGRGSAIRARILKAAAGGAISEAERLLHRHLHAAGITGWRANASIRLGSTNREGDVVFDDVKLLVEVDGFAFHTGHERYLDDRVRQNDFVVNGWTVLRFTWWQIVEEPDLVVGKIRAALARLRTR